MTRMARVCTMVTTVAHYAAPQLDEQVPRGVRWSDECLILFTLSSVNVATARSRDHKYGPEIRSCLDKAESPIFFSDERFLNLIGLIRKLRNPKESASAEALVKACRCF